MAFSEEGRKSQSVTTSTNKILPDDPRGLPWEIWQLVLSHLSALDLGHACCVCKTWNNLVDSLDGSRWRELYLQSTEWKSPYWPLNPECRPPSWKNSLRDQIISAKFWYHGSRIVDQSQCMVAFRRHRDRRRRRKTIHVGRNCEYDTLKSALSIANDYDRILIEPGIYDEQFEMSSKIPLELVGCGELGSVILVMCVEQTSVTGRLCNLVLRAPWFTSFALKVKAGYIQVDNCIIEDGLVLVQSPSTAHFKFCTFRHANIILQHVDVSLIENCEFSQCDLAAVSVEGFPTDELNWAQGYLSEITAINRGTVCPENSSEDGTKSTFSMQTKSSDTQEPEYGLGYNCGSNVKDLNRTRNNHSDWLFDNDGKSVSSSTVFQNVSSWLVSADHSGSQMTLTTVSDPQDNDLHHGSTDPNPESQHNVPHGSLDQNVKSRHSDPCGSLDHNLEPRYAHGHCPVVHNENNALLSLETEKYSQSFTDTADCSGSTGSATIACEKITKSNTLAKVTKICESDEAVTSDSILVDEPRWVIGHEREIRSHGAIRSQDVTMVTGLQNDTGSVEVIGSQGATEQKEIVGSRCVIGSKTVSKPEVEHGSQAGIGSDGSIPQAGTGSSEVLGSKGVIRSNSLGKKSGSAEKNVTGWSPKKGPVKSHDCFDLSDDESQAGRVSHGLHRTAGSIKPDDQILTELEIEDVLVSDTESAQLSRDGIESPHSREKHVEEYGPVHAWVHAKQLAPGDAGALNDPLPEIPPPADLQPLPREAAMNDGGEFVLDDLSSSEDGDSSEGGHDNSSTLSSSSSGTFSHTEFSLSDEELLVHLAYPQHRRPLQTSRAHNSVQPETSVCCKSKRISSGKTKRASLGVLTLWEDSDVVRAIEEVQGVTIRDCHMNLGKGGVMVSCQGHARVIGCHITNMGYGIRCVQNSRVLVLKNEIHHCRTSGIFMRLAASGVIAGNDIHSNMEAGVDVRKNADPIIQGNQIHHGERFGVAVLCSGQGQIRDNDIFANAEAGIYILYRGNPLICDNRLLNNQAAGISVNENGLGFIKDNMVSGNLWAGVYVRHGGDPFVQHNVICNGVADGVVIGEKGRGTIAKNVITGNAGCGVWIMGGECPLLHCNDISNNGDSGIAFVTNTSCQIDQETRGKPSNTRSSANLAIQELFIDNEKRETKPHYSQTKVQHNTVCHNAGHGLSIESGKDVMVGSNSIYGNSLSGVYINHPGVVTVCNNHITCNQETGLTTSIAGQANIYGNGILDNKNHGILCQNEAVIFENDIIGNQSASVIALQGTNHVKVEKNRLYSANGAPVIQVIQVTDDARGVTMVTDGARGVTMVTDGARGVTIGCNQVCIPADFTGDPEQFLGDHKLNATDNIFIRDERDIEDPSNLGPPPFPWKPGDPVARPHRHEPDDIPVLSPVRYVRSVAMVTNPDSGNCQGGSRTCAVL